MISPEAGGMSPEKAAFFNQLMSETQSKSKTELLPFLFGLSSRINQSGFVFTDEETDFIIRQLTAGFSPQEKKRVEMLRHFSRMLSQKNSSPGEKKP